MDRAGARDSDGNSDDHQNGAAESDKAFDFKYVYETCYNVGSSRRRA